MPEITRKAHQAERLVAIRLRYCINTHLDERGLTVPPDIARAVGLPPAEAVRLGLEVPLAGLSPSAGEDRAA
jgi:hypothetical protein